MIYDANNFNGMIETTKQWIKEETRYAFLAFCKLDTLAMVKILEKLKELTEENL